MKKALFLTAIASVALVSCVNDESAKLDEQARTKIAFDSPVLYGNENSRANVYGEIGSHVYGGQTYSYPREENFVIYAVSHEGDFKGWVNATAAAFNATAISFDSDVDGWAPKTSTDGYYYWESGKKMSFAATSPAELEQTNWPQDNRTYGATGLTITDFEVSADAAKQYDLLFSTRVCNQTSADMLQSASYYSGIPIKFQHALSSIRFSIANSSPETVVLTGITLEGVKYKGTFKENIEEKTTDYTLYDKSEDGNVSPEWSVTDDVITSPYLAFNGEVAFLTAPRYVSSLVEEADDDTNICNQLLLMPQELTENVILTVNYTVNGTSNHKDVILKGLRSGNDGAGEVINEWEMGKRYTYRLYYSSETADRDKIYFAPSTEEWEDVDVIIVNL